MYIKRPTILKYQKFDDSKRKTIPLIVYKCQQFDKYDNEKKQSLDKYKDNSDNEEYVSLFPITLFFLPENKSNHLSNLDERVKSLTYLIYIPKTTNQRNINFALEFSNKKNSKLKKKVY